MIMIRRRRTFYQRKFKFAILNVVLTTCRLSSKIWKMNTISSRCVVLKRLSTFDAYKLHGVSRCTWHGGVTP